ncbi:terminase small subunit [Gordonia phage Kiko]|nr:terminase small subunit [Gordonia phage Kiko]
MDFDDLEPGSQDLFDSLYDEGDPESIRTLAIEAVHTWNRLCKLNRVLTGDIDTWMTLTTVDGELRVTVDAALTAARTQAGSYRMLLEQIWRAKGGASAGEDSGGNVLTLIKGFIDEHGSSTAG